MLEYILAVYDKKKYQAPFYTNGNITYLSI